MKGGKSIAIEGVEGVDDEGGAGDASLRRKIVCLEGISCVYKPQSPSDINKKGS